MNKDKIIRFLEEKDIVCPNPYEWQLFYEIIVKRLHPEEYQVLNAEGILREFGIPYPLVLGGWGRSSEDKKKVFLEQLDIGFQHKLGEELEAYIFSLKPRDFFYFNSESIYKNFTLNGYDVSKLFDRSIPSVSFAENPRDHIPTKGSIIYSVWDQEENFIYIGISGLQKSTERRNPLSRMISHSSGRRSGDQFCIYIHDFYVIPKLIEDGEYTPSIGILDNLTRDFVKENLSYRFMEFDTDDSDEIVLKLENLIKMGALEISPRLNSKTSNF